MTRGRKPKNSLPKEIRENIVESNLPPHVLDAITEAVAEKPAVVGKPKTRIVGRHPVTGEPVWK